MWPSCIIIGGGKSINEGVKFGLWDKIRGKFTVGTNASFYFYSTPTIQTFVDSGFFKENEKEFLSLPMTIGKWTDRSAEYANVYTFLPSTKYLGKESIKIGRIYTSKLVGLFALTFVISLGVKKIYLLGYDWTKTGEGKLVANKRTGALDTTVTHFFQESDVKILGHGGQGKTRFYDNNDPNKYFKCYERETDVAIYNVNPNSNIENFSKITYKDMFGMLEAENYNQDKLRERIKSIISTSATRNLKVSEIKHLPKKRQMFNNKRKGRVRTSRTRGTI